MDFQVDSAEVRRVVKEIKGIAQNVKKLAAHDLNGMQGAVRESLTGEAADALMSVLDALSGDIGKIGSGLDNIEKALSAYAERIDRADEEARKAIAGE